MAGENEQRVAIKFCCKFGLSAPEAQVLVQKAYGNEALKRSKVSRLYLLFRDGRELVEDDESVGCPTSTVADLLKNDSRIASRMIAETLNIPKTVVLQILKEDLEKIKLCARFVPHFLKPEEREGRVTSCQDITAMVDADKHFFNKIITRDETWCFAYDPEKKRQISEWVLETSSWPKKLQFQKSASRPC
jgi:hypothetical protein